MAQSAPDVGEYLSASGNRGGSAWCVGRWGGWGEEAHEGGKLLNGAEGLGASDAIGVDHRVRHRRKLAAGRLVALGLKDLVGDAHLDVVRLAGEEQQRLVLCLPAKACNG